MNAIDQLKSVLCDPEGKCCIAGSDEDRAIVDRALQALSQPPLPVQPERQPLTDEQIRKWWASENGLEDCDMSQLDDFVQVVRAVEAVIGAKP
jgi:hypothetical protein